MELKVCLGFKMSTEIFTSMDLFICYRKVRGIIKIFASNFVDETVFKNRVTYLANSYLNHFLRTGNSLPLKHGGANYVVVSDWIQAYIEALFLCNPKLYLLEIRERDQDDLQLQPHEFPSISAICLYIQRLNFTFKKFTVSKFHASINMFSFISRTD